LSASGATAYLLKLVRRGRFKVFRFGHYRLAAFQTDILIYICGGILQLVGRFLYAKRVRSPTDTRCSFTSFILPIRFLEEDHVDAPYDDGATRFDRLGSVNEVAPNHIPAWMIVMRLDRPRPGASLRFKGFYRRRVELASQRQVRETLLCYV
jgi:hypothetical protein